MSAEAARKTARAAAARVAAARAVTSHDVAHLARVSQSAVSRAFTRGASIAPATRTKVMKAAAALDYRPNQVARALISERSGLVGLVIPPGFIPLYSLAMGEFAQRLPERGLQPLVLSTGAAASADDLVERFLEYRVDGVILTAATLSSRLAARCAQRGIAVIQFGRAELRARGARVSSDNLNGGRTAARILRACGARRAAYLGGDPDTSTDRDRAAGFMSEWPAAPRVSAGRFTYADGTIAARTLLRGKPRPDAVFCASDVLAYALVDVARHEEGLAIPRELMVMGVDDAPPSAWQGYALSTMRQDVAGLVTQTIDLLVERMAAPHTRARAVTVSMAPVLRATTRPLKAAALAHAVAPAQPVGAAPGSA